MGPSTAVPVLIVCPVRLYRDGIAARLRSEPGFRVVGGVGGPEEAVARLPETGPALVLLDAASARRPEVVRRLAHAAPGTTVVAMVLDDDEDAVVTWAEAGVVAYVPPGASLADLVRTVRAAVRGEMVCPPRVAGSLARRLTRLARRPPAPARLDTLTHREREVLALLGDGLSNRTIARRLHIQIPTVKNHVHRVLEKLAVPGRAAAADHARELPRG